MTFSFLGVNFEESVEIHITQYDHHIKAKQHDGADGHHIVERYGEAFLGFVASVVK